MVQIILKPGKEAAVKRYHPWIFSGAIQSMDAPPGDGDMVTVLSSKKEFLALGHYFTGSIAVKIFSFQDVKVNDAFWKSKLHNAFLLRRRLDLTDNPLTNAYRLVFSEGDGLPGLIIDFYNGVAVIQSHSGGMHALAPVFAEGLKEIYGNRLKAVYDKSSETLAKSHNYQATKPSEPLSTDQYLFGSSQSGNILEAGNAFIVDWERGQKTGFFLDQRNNRLFSKFFARDKRVLNLFCYSGAFSVYALKGGAKFVCSIDSSKPAIELTEENIRINGFDSQLHLSLNMDVKKYLNESGDKFDMVILDPPAFAKSHSITNNALHAYIHINAAAIRKLSPGGIMLTFSCSQAISRDMFLSAILSASLETGRNVRLLHHLSQAPDHPVSIYHPESSYLKGFVLTVD